MTEAKELERVRAIHKALDEWAAGPVGAFPGNYTYIETLKPSVGHEYTAAEVRGWPEMKRHMRDRLGHIPSAPVAVCGVSKNWDEGVFAAEPSYYPEIMAASIARGLCLYREQLTDSPSDDASPIKVRPGQAQGAGWVPKVGERVRIKGGMRNVGDHGELIRCDELAANILLERNGQETPIWFVDLEPAPPVADACAEVGEMCFNDGARHHYKNGQCVHCAKYEYAKQPDPYAAHRERLVGRLQAEMSGARAGKSLLIADPERVVFDRQRNEDNRSGATDLLNRNLASELDRPATAPRFPHPGRNFALTKREGES